MKLLVIAWLCLSLLLSSSTFAATRDGRTSKPKLIYIGWDDPSPEYIARHWKQMQEMSFFDGVTINPVDNQGASVRQRMLTRFKLTPENFTKTTTQIRTATENWKRRGTFTDNFIWLMLSPEDWTTEGKDFSWADDKLWIQINRNAATLARVAKQSGLKGFFLDPEQYNATKFLSCDFMWRRDGFKSAPGCTTNENARVPDAYQPLLKRRGKEFMHCILREYPDIVLMTTFGHSMVQYIGSSANLYAGFLDGMMLAMRDAPNARAVLIEGMELYGQRGLEDSPGCRTPSGFRCLYKDAMGMGKYFSTEPALFDRFIEGSPPVWIDMNRVWHTDDFTKNYYQPNGLQTAVASALSVTDRYVWMYSESACFFPTWQGCKPVPEPYLQAIHRARKQALR